mgnify:CR=1 FL=1|jgi:uncharacterized membrane protein YdjX (TVP38/TMEM64 family)
MGGLGVLLRKYQRLIVVVIFLVLAFLFFEVSGLRQGFNLENLRATLSESIISGAVLFILLFCAGNLIQIPGWIFLAAAVLTLDKLWGGVLTYVAAVTSCTVTYWLIKTLGGDALRQLESPIAKRIFSHLDEHPLRSQIVLRTIFQTVPALNYSLALSRVRPREYFLALLLGLPLPIILYCVGFEFLIDYFMASA